MDNHLRISQESLEMDDIISELNTKQPNTAKVHGYGTPDEDFVTSPKSKDGDETFAHYDDNNSCSQRASCETFTRELSPTSRIQSHQARPEVAYSYMVADQNQRAYTQNKPGYHHPQLIDGDIETFKTKLESTLLNFKNEAMKDFMGIKRNILQEQSNTIENERNKYNALLSSKQNEIETLKEDLAKSNKFNEDMKVRCDFLALLAGKNKQMTRLNVAQYKAFKALKSNAGFNKHSKKVLENKDKENKLKFKRRVFQAWGKHWKQWKIQKAKDDFNAK